MQDTCERDRKVIFIFPSFVSINRSSARFEARAKGKMKKEKEKEIKNQNKETKIYTSSLHKMMYILT